MTFDQLVQAVKWGMGALAAVAAFLLVQGDLQLEPWVEVLLGAYLVLAAYVNPASIAAKAGTAGKMIRPGDGGG